MIEKKFEKSQNLLSVHEKKFKMIVKLDNVMRMEYKFYFSICQTLYLFKNLLFELIKNSIEQAENIKGRLRWVSTSIKKKIKRIAI